MKCLIAVRYQLDPDAERRFIASGVESIHKATGQTPVGWNAYYVRNSPHTAKDAINISRIEAFIHTLQDINIVVH